MIKYFLPVLLLLLSCSTSRTELSEWRGTDRMGIYPDKDLLKEWPEEGPEELWTIDSLGRGYGSPQFTEDRFYITGEVDGMAILYCFDLDGNKLWQSTLGKEWVSTYPGSRSAPTIVGELIYTGHRHGGSVLCEQSQMAACYGPKISQRIFRGFIRCMDTLRRR